MEIKTIAIGKLKPNPNNPRTITEDKLSKLVQSIIEFPEMLAVRPIVVDMDMVVLGGNMRLEACKQAGIKKVHYMQVDMTEEQAKEFIIKDNVGFGQWDWDALANEWDSVQLGDWGLDVWQPEDDVDYSALDDDDNEGVDLNLDEMAGEVMRSIQIEFAPEYYDEATEVIKFWREQGANVGMMVLEHLKSERAKISE